MTGIMRLKGRNKDKRNRGSEQWRGKMTNVEKNIISDLVQ